MGDAASTLISTSTEEALREAARNEVDLLIREYRLSLAQSLFLSISEEEVGNKNIKVKWKLKRRTWKSYNRALHEAWCFVKAPLVTKKWKKLYCVARPDYTFEAYDTKESYSSAAKPKYSLRPSGYCILHDAEQWKHLWTRRTAILLQSETPKTLSKDKVTSPADYTICLSHPIKEPLFIGVETPADKEVWNLILCDFIRRTADLNTVDSISKHALGAAIERTRRNHLWRDPDLVSAGDELDVVYHMVTERLLGELGVIARRNPKLKNEKFLDKQRAIEVGFELAKQIARDTVSKFYQTKKSSVEVEVRALRPMLMKNLPRLKNNDVNKQYEEENVSESYGAMLTALDSLGPALDSGLSTVKTLFCDAVRDLKTMIIKKPVYVNHVDVWFLQTMDPLSRDPLKLRPLLKSLIKLPRPAAAAAYIHCQELLDSLVWTFEHHVSDGAVRHNGKLDKDEVVKLEHKVLERLSLDVSELRKMMLAKWLLNEGRQRLPNTLSKIEEKFQEKQPEDIFMRPRLVQERVMLEMLRKYADELVSPIEKPPHAVQKAVVPKEIVTESAAEKISEEETVNETEANQDAVNGSDTPSPSYKDSESFLASIVESAKDSKPMADGRGTEESLGTPDDTSTIPDDESTIPDETSPMPDEPLSIPDEPSSAPEHSSATPEKESPRPEKSSIPEKLSLTSEKPSPTSKKGSPAPASSQSTVPKNEKRSESSTKRRSNMPASTSAEKSSNPSVLNLAQLQALQKLRGIKPKTIVRPEVQQSAPPKTKKVLPPKVPEKVNVSVDYRSMNTFGLQVIGEGPPSSEAKDALTKVNKKKNAPLTKPTVICAKPTSPHVQALHERYVAQEAEVQKAEREREKRDALDKANSSAHSDGSVKSSSLRLRSKPRASKASPKPRTEQWVQEHMNNQTISTDEEMEQQKLNDDYEKRKHLYENLPNASNRSSPVSSRLTSSQPHLNLLKGDENVRSKSAVQANVITDMKVGSEPDCRTHSTESIPTKNTNRKKRAQERKNVNKNESSENEPDIQKDSLKSKSQIINNDSLNGQKRKKKKKKAAGPIKSNEKNAADNPQNAAESPGLKPVMKGYKDFNQLQAEMKQREKELKKKLKSKKKDSKSDSKNDTNNNTSDREQNEINTAVARATTSSSSSSDGENHDLQGVYIEEIVTERQFLDSDGNVKTEVTTVEHLKTKKKNKSNTDRSKSKSSGTNTGQLDTGVENCSKDRGKKRKPKKTRVEEF